MKATLLTLITAFALALTASAADVTVKLSEVHLCCQSCVKGAKAAVTSVKGATADVSQDDDTITITAADKATLQKATDALTAAGFFGTSSDPAVKVSSVTGAKNAKVKSVTISDMHLCCDKCVKAVANVVKSVPGATAQTAVKNAKTFEVTGDFNDKDLMDAFQKAGLTGTITKE
jgi:copper chaperone CopZ